MPVVEIDTDEEKSSIGGIVVAIIVIAVLILAGLYLFGKHVVNKQQNPQDVIENDSVRDDLESQGNSDQLEAIQTDLEATDFGHLADGLDKIDAELAR
jgi:hypothetical protein